MSRARLVVIILGLSSLAACGGGGSGSNQTRNPVANGFSLSVPGAVSVAQDASGSLSVTIERRGDPGEVALSLSGTELLSTTPGADKIGYGFDATGDGAKLTLAVGSKVAAGDYDLTITGKAGATSHAAAFTLTVTKPKSHLTLELAPARGTVAQAASTTFTVTAETSGTNASVALDLQGSPVLATSSAPDKIAYSFDKRGPGEFVLTLDVGATVEPGGYTLTVHGAAGEADAEAPLALAVTENAVLQTTATITAVNRSEGELQNVPLTFGQPFRKGDVPQGYTVAAWEDGRALPTQVNVKARNPDGSLRHAVVTVELPALAASAAQPLALKPVRQPTATGHTITLADVLASGFDASVHLSIAGRPWSLDARALLRQAANEDSCKPWGKSCKRWLSGPLASAWIVGGPLLDAQGNPHPHLAVYFAVRAYGPGSVTRVRLGVIVENDWAYAADPQNVTYDATIEVGGEPVYSISDLEHYRQSRWHEVFWWGADDPLYARQDSLYLQATKAVPRFEDVPAPEAWLARRTQTCAPMKRCDQTGHMGNTGAQAAIGPLPRWTSAYVIHPSFHAFRWMLANSDALGSYATHYRDRTTGRTMSLADHPCATVIWAGAPRTCKVPPHGDDRFPKCPGDASCGSPLKPNEAHHPSPAYVAYLVTGDWYYLSELTYWVEWVVMNTNPAYRDYSNGRVSSFQTRGQAWALRSLGYAAYILPDDDPFKSRFDHMVAYNLAWYNRRYTDNPDANALHIITNGYQFSYPNHGERNTGIATWQNSFFTWSVGNLRDLGFPGAEEFLNWTAKFQIGLMTDPGYCWIEASAYEIQVRDTRESPVYGSFGDVYANSFPALDGVECNSQEMADYLNERDGVGYYAPDVMSGYPYSPTGFPANFQIGLAEAADSSVPLATAAWQRFATRALQPDGQFQSQYDYKWSPQFALVPRAGDK